MGSVKLHFKVPENVQRYQFALQTADFLICKSCGVFIAAIASGEAGLRATVNVNALDDRASFNPCPTKVSYEGETASTRLARRARLWTPVSMYP